MERTLSEKIIDTGGSSDAPRELEEIGRRRICCFTGHRPDRLPDGGDPRGAGMAALRERTETYIRMLMTSGHDVFITGMSRGFDLLAAEILTTVPDIAANTKVICAVPYALQYNEMRTGHEKNIYGDTIRASLYVVKLFGKYTDGCYKARNQLMVNCSSVLVGYLAQRDMIRSGSAQTIRMAKSAGLDTVMIYGNEI